MNTLINKEDIQSVVFGSDSINIVLKNGKQYTQGLKFYPMLEKADKKERQNFVISALGLHWRSLDTDISFESFLYDFSKPFVYHS